MTLITRQRRSPEQLQALRLKARSLEDQGLARVAIAAKLGLTQADITRLLGSRRPQPITPAMLAAGAQALQSIAQDAAERVYKAMQTAKWQ